MSAAARQHRRYRATPRLQASLPRPPLFPRVRGECEEHPRRADRRIPGRFARRLHHRASPKFTLEKVRLIFAVESDLKPDIAVSFGNRFERG